MNPVKMFACKLALVQAEQAYRHFERTLAHPYRSLIGGTVAALASLVMYLWTFLVSTGLLFGLIHITH